MNMGQLYVLMKEALAMFGLRFHEMEQVSVRLSGDWVCFEYGGAQARYRMPSE